MEVSVIESLNPISVKIVIKLSLTDILETLKKTDS